MRLLQIDGVLLLTRHNGIKLISVERKRKELMVPPLKKVENSIKPHVIPEYRKPFFWLSQFFWLNNFHKIVCNFMVDPS